MFEQDLRIGWLVAGAVAGAVFIVAALVYARFRRDIRAARARLHKEGGRFVETACGPFEYAVLGENFDPDTAVSSFYDTIERDPHRWLTPPDDHVPVLQMWVRAVGYKAGCAACCTCWFSPDVWDVGGYSLTSVALVVAVLKILRGEIRERGGV